MYNLNLPEHIFFPIIIDNARGQSDLISGAGVG